MTSPAQLVDEGGIVTLLQAWQTIDEEIGKAGSPERRQQLVARREDSTSRLITVHLSELRALTDRSPNSGWQAWVDSIARTISEFRWPFARRLCDDPPSFGSAHGSRLVEVRTAVGLMTQSRWSGAYSAIEFLVAERAVSDLTTARLLAVLGQIRLYHFSETEEAKQLLDRALLAAPADERVVCAVGDYWQHQGDLDTAVATYDEAAKRPAAGPYAFIGLAECCEKRQDLAAAEKWYRVALESGPGDGNTYVGLIKFFGRRENFPTREHELPPLVERALAVAPESTARRYVELGDIYAQNDRHEDARDWYTKAIAVDAESPASYVSLAALLEKEEHFGEAEHIYRKAIALAPEELDAYAGLGGLFERLQRWEDAFELYQRFPRQRRDYVRFSRARAGAMLTKLGRTGEAEARLTSALIADPKEMDARNALEELAEEHYTKRGDRGAAMNLYAEILRIVGAAYASNYHNRLGNLYSFFGETELAIENYREAIRLGPEKPIYRWNVGDAYVGQKAYDEARRAYESAFRLDNDVLKRSRKMALVVNAEGNDLFALGQYAQAAEHYKKAIELTPKDDVLYANLGGAYEHVQKTETGTWFIDEAIAAFTQAHSVSPAGGYEQSVERLRRKKELATTYGDGVLKWVHAVTPIAIEGAANLTSLMEGDGPSTLSKGLATSIANLRNRLATEFCVSLPGVRVRTNEADLPHGVYVILIMEVPIVSGTVSLDQRFAPVSAEALARIGVQGEETTHPVNRETAFWIKREDWPRVQDARLELWDVIEYPVRHLEAVIRQNLTTLFGHDDVATIASREEGDAGRAIRDEPGLLTALTTVCAALAAEQVPLNPFSVLWSEFERLHAEGADLQSIVERIRALPSFRNQLPGAENRYKIRKLGPRFLNEVRNAIARNGSHVVLAMEPEPCQEALSAVRLWVDEDPTALVVDDPSLRPFIRKLVELEFPHVPVLSVAELDRPVAGDDNTIELDDDSSPMSSSGERRLDRRTPIVQGRLPAPGRSPSSTAPRIKVMISEAFIAQRAKSDDKPLSEMLSLMQDGLFYELGIILPKPRVEIDNTLREDQFAFSIPGRVHPPVDGLRHGETFINETPDRLRLLGIDARPRTNPATGAPGGVVRDTETASDTLADIGLTTWGPSGFLVLALAQELRKAAADFHTLDLTRGVLDSLRGALPETVDRALKRFTLEEIHAVLLELLDEEISIRNLRDILEALLSINGSSDVDVSRYIVFSRNADNFCFVNRATTTAALTTLDYCNFVRSSFKRYISHKYSYGGNTLVVYLLHEDIERMVASQGGRLGEVDRKRVLDAIRDETASHATSAQFPVILTSMHVRAAMRSLIKTEFPRLAVVSYQELSPDLNIQPIARISLS